MTGEAALANVTGTSLSSSAREDATLVQAGNEPGPAREDNEADRRRLEMEKAALLSRCHLPRSMPWTPHPVSRTQYAPRSWGYGKSVPAVDSLFSEQTERAGIRKQAAEVGAAEREPIGTAPVAIPGRGMAGCGAPGRVAIPLPVACVVFLALLSPRLDFSPWPTAQAQQKQTSGGAYLIPNNI